MTEKTRESELALWRQMTQIPHRAYGSIVATFRAAIADNPDFSARAMVYLFKTSKIRDQQDAAVIAMLGARSNTGGAYAQYRQAGKAMLFGKSVYNIQPDGPWGLEPYRILRIVRFMASPFVVTRGNEELERFHTEKAAFAALPTIARREMTKANRKWRPGPDDGDEALVRRLGLTVGKDLDHIKSVRLMQTAVKDYLNALHANPDWWLAVEFQNREALHSLYFNKSATPRGFKPPDWVNGIVFHGKYPMGTKQAAIKAIAQSDDPEVWFQMATEYRLDDRILSSVLPNTTEAKMVRVSVMTPNQVRNSNWIERDGLLEIPEIKAAVLEKLAQATDSSGAFERKSAQFKDADVAEVSKKARDEAAKSGERIKGSVGVLVDISASMKEALQKGAVIAAQVAANAEDEVWMSFFDDTGRAYNVTGYNLSDIEQITRMLRTGGWTSVRAGFDAMHNKGFTPNKMVIVTDEGENRGRLSTSLRNTNWEGQISVVRVGQDQYTGRALSRDLVDKGYHPDIIETQDVEDYLLAEQVAELLGGPAAQTIADKIAATEIPMIV